MTTKERKRLAALKAKTALNDEEKAELTALEAKAAEIEEEESEEEDDEEEPAKPPKAKRKRARNDDAWPDVAALSDEVDTLKAEFSKLSKRDWFPVIVAFGALFVVWGVGQAKAILDRRKANGG